MIMKGFCVESQCQNCTGPLGPGYRRYCGDTCKRSWDRKRQRLARVARGGDTRPSCQVCGSRLRLPYDPDGQLDPDDMRHGRGSMCSPICFIAYHERKAAESGGSVFDMGHGVASLITGLATAFGVTLKGTLAKVTDAVKDGSYDDLMEDLYEYQEYRMATQGFALSSNVNPVGNSNMKGMRNDGR
jgi:hypothetical protein